MFIGVAAAAVSVSISALVSPWIATEFPSISDSAKPLSSPGGSGCPGSGPVHISVQLSQSSRAAAGSLLMVPMGLGDDDDDGGGGDLRIDLVGALVLWDDSATDPATRDVICQWQGMLLF